MACRRAFQCGAVLSMSLVLLAIFADRSPGQAVGAGTGSVGAGAGSSSGTGATAISAGFTGGGGGGGGGYTGGTASGTGATMATGGFTGGSATGSSLGFTGGGGLTSGTSTNVPSSVNPFVSTYTNAYGAGLLNTSGQASVNKPFGQALYSTYSTAITGSTASGGFGGAGGIGGVGGAGIGGIGGMGTTTMSTANVAFNTFGMSRTPYYAATLGDGMPRVVHANPQLQANVADVVRRSTYVQSTTPLKIAVRDGTVFLEGAVPTEKQRRLVEGLIRTTPGVRAVVNNLEVTETLPTPTKSAARLGP